LTSNLLYPETNAQMTAGKIHPNIVTHIKQPGKPIWKEIGDRGFY